MLFDSVEIKFFGPFLRISLSMTTSDDKPWINREIKELDRKRIREFFKNHKSEKLRISRLSLIIFLTRLAPKG